MFEKKLKKFRKIRIKAKFLEIMYKFISINNNNKIIN